MIIKYINNVCRLLYTYIVEVFGYFQTFLTPFNVVACISNCLLAYNISGKLNLFLTTPVGLRILSAELPLLRNHDPRTKWAFVHGEYYNQNLQTPFFCSPSEGSGYVIVTYIMNILN